MCGIVGYVGPRPAAHILLEGLRRLEYRGYDSAGVAVINGDGVKVRKAAGKLAVLRDQLKNDAPEGTVGIGHTRWATHGAPTTPNAHPHLDGSGKIALIHNGIIENASSIKTLLIQRGHTFTSETDTEVLAHLVGEYYRGSLEEAVASALRDTGFKNDDLDEVGRLMEAGRTVLLLAVRPEDTGRVREIMADLPELKAADRRWEAEVSGDSKNVLHDALEQFKAQQAANAGRG